MPARRRPFCPAWSLPDSSPIQVAGTGCSTWAGTTAPLARTLPALMVGVALAIAVLGSASATTGLASFDAWFEVSAAIAVMAAVVSIALGRPDPDRQIGERLWGFFHRCASSSSRN